jgi:hypothetical protein
LRRYEILFAVVVVALFTLVNATSDIMDNARDGGAMPAWLFWLREASSGVGVLAAIPALVWLHDWLNLGWSNLRWRMLWHVPAFVAFSVFHILIFTLLRKAGHSYLGQPYASDGVLWFEFLYELRKDLLVYLGITILLHAYDFILTRLQGEASFLSQQHRAAEPTPVVNGYRDQFLVKMLQREYLVRVEDIQWIEAARNYVLLHCRDRSYPMRQTLTGVLAELDPEQYLRVHRSAIVNLDCVETIEAVSREDRRLRLRGGQLVPLSQTYLARLREHFVPAQDGLVPKAIPGT